jgi:hypothetical protein
MNLVKAVAVVSALLVLGVPAARSTNPPGIILDTLNASSTATFSLSAGWGGLPITTDQHIGPGFTLALPTTITEIGSFVNNCSGVYCDAGPPPLTAEIRRAVGGAPDPSNVIASFPLSDDGDPQLISYESAKPDLLLQPGSYFALFSAQRPEDRGGFALTLGCDPSTHSCNYRPAVTTVGVVTPGVSSSVASVAFPARILGIEHTSPPAKTVKLAGSVGPGVRISFPRSARPGKAIVTIHDRTRKDNFHLSGPGVNRRTGIAFTGTVTWTVTLKHGTYIFRSDARRLGGRTKVG